MTAKRAYLPHFLVLAAVIGFLLLIGCGDSGQDKTAQSTASTTSAEFTAPVVSAGNVSLPIVLYHRLLPPEHEDLGNSAITPELFEQDLSYIQEKGFTTIFLQEAIDFVHGKGTLPPNPFVICFDDGYYNNYLYALPLLQKYEMKASLAVISNRINDASAKMVKDLNYGYCSWDILKEMLESGCYEITSHTYAMHVQKPRKGMTRLEGESDAAYRSAIEEDVKKQKDILKSKLGIDSGIIMYPYGLPADPGVQDIYSQYGIELTGVVISNAANLISSGDERCLMNLGRYNRPYGIETETFFDRVIAEGLKIQESAKAR